MLLRHFKTINCKCSIRLSPAVKVHQATPPKGGHWALAAVSLFMVPPSLADKLPTAFHDVIVRGYRTLSLMLTSSEVPSNASPVTLNDE